MTKDALRQRFKNIWHSRRPITISDIYLLQYLIQKELDDHHNGGGMRMHIRPINLLVFKMIKEKGFAYRGLSLKVIGPYFTGRDGVDIMKNGDVWFCGWASSSNEKPFILAFEAWLQHLEQSAKREEG